MAAKRHHFVPRMLLKRFAVDPAVKLPQVCTLDMATGKPRVSNIANESVISNYNKIDDPAVHPDPLAAERAFAEIEAGADIQIDRLIDKTGVIEIEWGTLAWFIWLQFTRTPLVRKWMKDSQEWAAKETLLEGVGNDAIFQKVVDRERGTRTTKELNEYRRNLREAILSAEIQVVFEPNAEVTNQFFRSPLYSAEINQKMSWIGLRPTGKKSFILGDHPVAIHDPGAGPIDPVAWFSSPTVQVTLPLAPDYCLVMCPGPPIFEEHVASDEFVQNVNLRSYAWAHWNIYGHSQDAVASTRALAKKKKKLVRLMEPRPPVFRSEDYRLGDTEPFRIRETRSSKRGTRTRRSSQQ